jgi:peptide subunit release factor RF-3
VVKQGIKSLVGPVAAGLAFLGSFCFFQAAYPYHLIRREQLNYRYVRWITKTPKPLDKLKLSSTCSLAQDSHDRDVILFENEWSIRWALEHNEGLELAETASRNID